MPAIEVKPGIYWIGINDRTTDLFEGIWPITQGGVSYNSYLVMDQKKALIDLTKESQEGSFLDQIEDVIDPAELDYIVLNHMEPDHTGALGRIRRLAPQATILCTEKAKGMLEAFSGITDDVQVVSDGEIISLGDKALQFFVVPFVHWPETMVTYEPSQKVLFACDAFGGYGALRGAIFDDQCADIDFYIQESLRYYVNIIARFSGPVLRAIDKLAGVDIGAQRAVIAPSHGLVWRHDPGRIVALYQHWAQYATSAGDPGVTLIYGSMYGKTEEMMNAVAEGVAKTGLPMEIFDAARTHSSYILPSLWTKNGVLIGAPTYEVSLFPPMSHVLEMANHKRIKNRRAAYFGSYGWSGGAYKDCVKLTEPLEWEWMDALEVQGRPSREDLHRAEDLGEHFARLIAEG